MNKSKFNIFFIESLSPKEIWNCEIIFECVFSTYFVDKKFIFLHFQLFTISLYILHPFLIRTTTRTKTDPAFWRKFRPCQARSRNRKRNRNPNRAGNDFRGKTSQWTPSWTGQIRGRLLRFPNRLKYISLHLNRVINTHSGSLIQSFLLSLFFH